MKGKPSHHSTKKQMKNDPRNRKQYDEALIDDLIQMKPHQFADLLTKFAPQLSKSQIDTITLEASELRYK